MNDFTTDWEKMFDFWNISKKEFLKTYSYLTEEEYDNTCLVTIGHKIESEETPERTE